MNKPLYVIQFDNGMYWCGYNHLDKQLRKAVVYSSLKHARQSADDVMKRKRTIIGLGKVQSYKMLEVEIIVKGEVKEDE